MAAADELRANSTLTAAQYRDPVLGLIFLVFAEHRFEDVRPELKAKQPFAVTSPRDDYRARGVLLPEIARLSHLVALPEGEDLGANVDLDFVMANPPFTLTGRWNIPLVDQR